MRDFRTWTDADVEAYNARVRGAITAPTLPDKVDPMKKAKYGNQKVVIDGITFDSKREGSRYVELKMMEKSGIISNLTLQPSYELAPAATIQGKKKKALTYRADFCYTENGLSVIEDCKGMKTNVYILKRHLMKSVHGIDILET